MKRHATSAKQNRVLTISVPLKLARRGSRKVVIAPNGGSGIPTVRFHVDSILVKAIARAHRWKDLMESGEYGSITELAAAEQINQSYLCRILRLTLLAPDIVESLLNGRNVVEFDLVRLLKPFPAEWRAQLQMPARYHCE